MPLKKKQTKNKAKEELPQSNSMLDGNCNYYVGGWSHYQSVLDITNIAHTIVNSHVGDDRRIKPLPRTTIFLSSPLSASSSSSCSSAVESLSKENLIGADEIQEDDNGNCRVVVCDKMSIEGIGRRTIKDAKMHLRELLPSELVCLPHDITGSESSTNTNAITNIENKTVEREELLHESSGVASEIQELENKNIVSGITTATAAVIAATVIVDSESEEEDVDDYVGNTSSANNNDEYKLRFSTVECGANFSAQDVCIKHYRTLIVSGVTPCIVIDPVLPTPPAELKDGLNATQNNSSNSSNKSSKDRRTSSKRRSKVKQTPEELEELERKRVAAEALFTQQTNEAIAKAHVEEKLISTFAHPDKWAHVVFTNVTFSVPLVIQNVHVVFQHCRFVQQVQLESSLESLPQLTVSQYCHVRCVHCTFELPVSCGVYAYPTSEVKLEKCLFTGISHVDLIRSKFIINGANTQVDPLAWNERISKAQTIDTKANLKSHNRLSLRGNNGADAINVEIHADADADADVVEHSKNMEVTLDNNDSNALVRKVDVNSSMCDSTTNNELFLLEELAAQYRQLQQVNPSAVGVFADQACVSVNSCQFLFLKFGCVFSGCYPSYKHSQWHMHQSSSESMISKAVSVGKTTSSQLSESKQTKKEEITEEVKTKVATLKHAASKALITVFDSHFYHLHGSGIALERDIRHVNIESNIFANCAYYAIDVQRKVRNSNLTNNTFSHNALLRIRAGAKPRVLHNAMEMLMINENKYENACMQLSYEETMICQLENKE